jgi:prolyl oligopeptidase
MNNTRFSLTLARTLVLLVAAAAAQADNRTVAGVPMPALWPAGDAADTHWGTRVPDPYRALENVKDEPVQRWLRAQADSTQAVLKKLPGRDALLARMQAIESQAQGAASSIQRSDDGRLFFLRRNPDEQQPRLMLRESLDADPARDRVLVDTDALSKAAGRPVALMDYRASPDGKKLAYALQVSGGEIGELRVIEIDGGKLLAGPLDRIRSSNVSWLPDSQSFFYDRLREGFEAMPATERFQDRNRLYRRLDGREHVVFSASRYPELGLPPIAQGTVFAVPGRPALAAAIVTQGVDRNQELLLADMAEVRAGPPKWRRVVAASDQVSQMAVFDGMVYLRSAQGAPRFQLLRMPLDAPDMAKAEVVLAQSASVLTAMAGARDALYLTQRDGVVTTLWRLPRGAKAPERVALPIEGTVGLANVDSDKDGAVLVLGGWTRASALFRYDPASAKLLPLQLAKLGAFDAPPGIQSREVLVRSHDGVMVPLSILSRSDVKLDGSNPTLLYGYGAYGTVESPGFSARLLTWLERGGVYAIAHVRGGGVYGKGWHDAGHKATKPNTWRDGIAAAEWLIANGYTRPARLAVFGGSAGGIFVGRAITERPDLFAAGISSVGVLDTVRSEARANGVANVPEYGTVSKGDEFRGLLAMSSYHALKNGTAYPAVMLTHGVNDIRVDVWQSAKFAARAQANPAQVKPVLMRLDYEAGHGGGSSRDQAQERQADIWAFLLWQFGEPGFQPGL